MVCRQVRVRTLVAIKEALEAAGVEFVGAPTDHPGVRLRTDPKRAVLKK